MLEGREKVTRVRWKTPHLMVYTCPKSGQEHEISIQMIRDTADSFDSRAEWLLNSMGVPDLTDEEVNSIIAWHANDQ